MLTMRNNQTKTTSMKHKNRTDSNGGKTMNILCATDDKYAPYCGVMLTSFLENHKDFHTEVYIIVKNSLKEEKRLRRLEERYDVKVNIMEFPFNEIASSFPINNGLFSVETYYRLFAADILPEDMERILYLDCDIIVDGDVSDIYFSDLDGISAFVAYDIPERMTQSHCVRLGYPKEYGYFNAGMMMINLNFWREHDIKKRCVNYITEHHDILTLYDQDVLNYVLQDSKKYVSVLYNFQENTLQKYNYDMYSPAMKKEVDTCRPKIIHFTTPAKPWVIFSYPRPFYKLWHRYKNISMWRHVSDKLPEEKPFNYFIKRYFLWPLGIYLPKSGFVCPKWI